MSLPNPTDVVTEQRLNEYHENLVLPYIGRSADAGFTPVGTIIALDSNTPPANYLACDGTVYNIADYPELAEHYKRQYGAANHYGGNGTTTFAVIDLQGEFLRGTGTNSHANQGSGANVGVHQDATSIPEIGITTNGGSPVNNAYIGVDSNGNVLSAFNASQRDSTGARSNAVSIKRANVSGESVIAGTTSLTHEYFTTRPTNTSVLFCIATKNIYLNPSLDYSTDEKVVGTWVNGATLYQKTIVDTFPSTSNEIKTVAFTTDLEETISIKATVKYTVTNGTYFQDLIAISQDMNTYARAWTEIKASDGSCNVLIQTNNSVFLNCPVYVIVQYTKTTT